MPSTPPVFQIGFLTRAMDFIGGRISAENRYPPFPENVLVNSTRGRRVRQMPLLGGDQPGTSVRGRRRGRSVTADLFLLSPRPVDRRAWNSSPSSGPSGLRKSTFLHTSVGGFRPGGPAAQVRALERRPIGTLRARDAHDVPGTCRRSPAYTASENRAWPLESEKKLPKRAQGVPPKGRGIS